MHYRLIFTKPLNIAVKEQTIIEYIRLGVGGGQGELFKPPPGELLL